MTWPGSQQTAPTANPGRAVPLRLVAWIIDLVMYWLVSFGTFALLAQRTTVESFGSRFCTELGEREAINECFDLNGTAWYTTGGRTMAHFACLLAWFLGIHVILQGLKGGSLGKLATGVRVVKEDGGPPGVGRTLVRSLLWIVDGLPCCMPLVGLVTLLATGRKQRVGDLVAGTFVVRADERGRPVTPAGSSQAPSGGPGAYPGTSGYPPNPGYPPPPPQGYPPPPQGYPTPPPPQGYPPG